MFYKFLTCLVVSVVETTQISFLATKVLTEFSMCHVDLIQPKVVEDFDYIRDSLVMVPSTRLKLDHLPKLMSRYNKSHWTSRERCHLIVGSEGILSRQISAVQKHFEWLIKCGYTLDSIVGTEPPCYKMYIPYCA